MDKVILNNSGYYPRLQINKHGEIVLATDKKDTLTTGILVGKTAYCKSKFPLGKKFDDWEVVGELFDYDGEVTVTIQNKVKNES